MNKTPFLSLFFLSLLVFFHQPAFSQSEVNRGVKNKVLLYPQNGQIQQVSLYDNSYALVIGMSKYKHWRPLAGPVKDVEEVGAVLKDHGFDVQVEMDLTGEELERKINQFIKKHGLDGNNRLLVYFAGHGETLVATDKREIGYIVPVDAPLTDQNEKEFKQVALSMQRIQSFADEIQTKHAMFVFDSCFSGQLLSTRDGRIIPPYIGEYLDNPVRQFISSGSGNQKVPDDSLFRRFFVEGLRGAADIDGDGYITGSELAKFLYMRVTVDSTRYQTTQYGRIQNTNLERGDMVFFLTQNAGGANEEQAWTAAKSKNTYQDYMVFINSFRNGKYFQEAVQSLLRIERAKAPETLLGSVVKETAVRDRDLKKTLFEFTTVNPGYTATLVDKTKMTNDSVDVELGKSLNLKLVRVPAGSFQMGSNRATEEKPIREVKVNEFYMSAFEITQKQWEAVAQMGKIRVDLPPKPAADLVGDNLPVVGITWEEAEEFCQRLSRFTGKIISLPSEAEWEYAARAGTETPFYFGSRVTAEIVNFNAAVDSKEGAKGLRRNRLIEVGSLGVANKYGLYDMHGNAAEWVQDGWEETYEKAPTDGSARVGSPHNKVIRGGSYVLVAGRVCSTCRAFEGRTMSSELIGFRVVLRSPVLN